MVSVMILINLSFLSVSCSFSSLPYFYLVFLKPFSLSSLFFLWSPIDFLPPCFAIFRLGLSRWMTCLSTTTRSVRSLLWFGLAFRSFCHLCFQFCWSILIFFFFGFALVSTCESVFKIVNRPPRRFVSFFVPPLSPASFYFFYVIFLYFRLCLCFLYFFPFVFFLVFLLSFFRLFISYSFFVFHLSFNLVLFLIFSRVFPINFKRTKKRKQQRCSFILFTSFSSISLLDSCILSSRFSLRPNRVIGVMS